MSLWQRFRDRIFNAPSQRNNPAKSAHDVAHADEVEIREILREIEAAIENHRRNARTKQDG